MSGTATPVAAGPDASLLDMDKIRVDPTWALRLPANVALRRNVLPFALHEGVVYVACIDDRDHTALNTVERLVQHPIKAKKAEPESLKRLLLQVYGSAGANAAQARSRSVDLRTLGEMEAEDAVGLSDELMHAGILRQASDIHIDPDEDGLLIRMRVDGVLEQYRKLPMSVHAGLVSRFKVMSNLDIAERRAPQDGGFKYSLGGTGKSLDIRTATIPTVYGERMTLRLLAMQTESLTLERLGMRSEELKHFEFAIDRPHGMILMTGPTGSGKSTTLYAALRRLISRESLNVITIEDPVEYHIRGVAQVEIDQADKVSFAKALRSTLRQDPDVIMIGEIRDQETADIAIKSALTGHLVFSTLHTNSALGVLTRLVHMGVERYLIAASLRLAAAQRLVRRLCDYCKKPRPITEVEARLLRQPEIAGQQIFEPGGCLYCNHRGYSGRMALFELVGIDEAWAEMIVAGAEEGALVAEARRRKVATLLEDGVAKLLEGRTSVSEVVTAVV